MKPMKPIDKMCRVLDRACLAGLTLGTAYLIIRTIIG
jgi:hypothetical protein